MSTLNQIVAVEKGVKNRVNTEVSELYKTVQKPDLFNGFARVYEKLNESGESLPEERQKVKFTATEMFSQVSKSLSELMDITFRKDATNCVAKADVIVDGKKVLEDVPATYLLFLEKQLTDLRTFVSTMPLLDDAEDWDKDVNSDLFRTKATRTHRTKKEQKGIVLYQATEFHPAQTQLITEDVLVGYWNITRFSGALPKPQRQKILNRTESLLKAVKEAREAANSIEEVSSTKVGDKIFSMLFGE